MNIIIQFTVAVICGLALTACGGGRDGGSAATADGNTPGALNGNTHTVNFIPSDCTVMTTFAANGGDWNTAGGGPLLLDDPSPAITTIAGRQAYDDAIDGPGVAATFHHSSGGAPDARVYRADTNNDQLRKIASGGAVNTAAGIDAALIPMFTRANSPCASTAWAPPTVLVADAADTLQAADAAAEHATGKMTNPDAPADTAGAHQQSLPERDLGSADRLRCGCTPHRPRGRHRSRPRHRQNHRPRHRHTHSQHAGR